MHLEYIMLSEISQTERQILYVITYIWNLKTIKQINIAKEEQTHREQTNSYQGERDQEKGQNTGRELRGVNYSL